MNLRRSDKATADDCQWDFIHREDLMDGLRAIAARNARNLPDLDADDILQELVLWIAVRPEIQDDSTGRIIYRVKQRVDQFYNTDKHTIRGEELNEWLQP